MFYNDFDNPDNNSIIDLEKYKEICKVCDEILLSPDANEVTVAIPILHVIREHPVFLKQYESLFSLKINKFRLDFKKNIYLIIFFLKSILVLFSKTKFWKTSSKLKSKYDYIFVSHLLNESQAGNINDFYFDNIPNILKKEGYDVLIVLLNHTNKTNNKLIKSWSEKDLTRIILSDNVGIFKELVYLYRFFVESMRLSKIANKEEIQLKKSILQLASRQFEPTIKNLRISNQFYELSKQIGIKNILVTHEGHAWERSVFFATKINNPSVLCIGYQHSLIFKEQHSIRRSLKNNYNPDIILTSGKMAKHELQILKNIYIDVLGSNRIENKYENIHKKNIKKTILVIPEAILSECLLLFCFSIKFAETYKDIDFVWRLHPLMNFKELASNGLNLQNLPNNVKLSNDRIEADIENCQYALYRGSSAVLKCISKGLRPIYLTISDEMTIDPLYRTKAYKWEVENIEQLNNLLINERLIVNNEQNDLIDHISNLMSIFDINVLLNLDKKIKISNTISC